MANVMGARGVIGVGALLLAAVALYVLLDRDADRAPESAQEQGRQALDDIDAKSREAMRDLLREAGNEDE